MYPVPGFDNSMLDIILPLIELLNPEAKTGLAAAPISIGGEKITDKSVA